MRIPGTGRAKQWLRRIHNRISPGALILLYHRVTELENDPQCLAVSPRHFQQQLEVLNRLGWGVFPLRDLASAFCDSGVKPTRRALAITFDDGYVDNLTQAKPLLEKHHTPATVFVTAGMVGSRDEFYWDELERLLLATPIVHGMLNVAGKSWQIEPSGNGVARGWNVLRPDTPSQRHAAYRELCALLTDMTPLQRRQVLSAIRQWAGFQPAARESHRMMTRDELRQLVQGRLIDVGAHTLTHPRLATLDPAEQRREIAQSKRLLEEMLGQPVACFAYPYGNHCDYTPDTIAAVTDAAFDLACTNFGGSVRLGADPLTLNRVLVRDWGGDEFERRIKGWFHE